MVTVTWELRPGSDDYPVGLDDLEDPPLLYGKGSLVDLPHVAIVGTRKCTRYGIDLAESFGRHLADIGWVTVSGLARGIDAAAHRGSTAGLGIGLAVLGSGIDTVYPKENRPILDALLEAGGAVVSEYPGNTPPDRWRFPARNRIIAAMSAAVVVVESAITGGAQITATIAAEIGRPVFAVPGDVDRPASTGTNNLIRDGAIPVFGPADLVAELSLALNLDVAASPQPTGQIPSEGVELVRLPEIWDCSASEALIRLGRLEMDGLATRSGDRVVPIPPHRG